MSNTNNTDPKINAMVNEIVGEAIKRALQTADPKQDKEFIAKAKLIERRYKLIAIEKTETNE